MTLALIAGIITGAVFAYFYVDWVYLLIPFVVLSAGFALFVLKFRRVGAAVCFALIALSYIAAYIYAYFLCLSFIPVAGLGDNSVYIQGTVDRVGTTSKGGIYLILKNCSVQHVALDGRIMAYLGDEAGEYCEKGYTVDFYSALASENLFTDGEISLNAQNGIKYYCSVTGGMRSEWGFSLFGTVNGAIRRALFDNLDKETAAVCFAMLTGDSSAISEGTLTSFRYGGVAHLFAVSGLHIGVIFGALTVIFKKIPLNRFVSAGIRVAVIIIYAGVCNFTPSSVRATVMCGVAAFAGAAYVKNDSLNALSFAAYIVLLINPLYLFGAGFLLSFGAALGIIMLRHTTVRMFGFLPSKMADGVSTGLSAQLVTAPIQFACFGYVSWAGLILNIIIIPVISVAFLLLFFCTFFAVIIPPAAAALTTFSSMPIQLLINAVVELGFENAIISSPSGLWMYAPFAVILCALTDKFNLKPALRTSLASFAAVGICVGLLI